jgi:preprotein translocase subunit SecA
MQIENPEEIEAQERLRRAEAAQKMNFQHSQLEASEDQAGDGSSPQNKAETFVREERKVGRNEPCPCGSGKKYKQCHGRI